MNRITLKKHSPKDVFRLTLEAPDIARERKAGTNTLICQAVGASTRMLSWLGVEDEIANSVGALGFPTHVVKFRPVMVRGGGLEWLRIALGSAMVIFAMGEGLWAAASTKCSRKAGLGHRWGHPVSADDGTGVPSCGSTCIQFVFSHP